MITSDSYFRNPVLWTVSKGTGGKLSDEHGQI